MRGEGDRKEKQEIEKLKELLETGKIQAQKTPGPRPGSSCDYLKLNSS